MGDGSYILAIKKELQKALGIKPGDELSASLQVDSSELTIDESLLACLEDEPQARDFLKGLAASHQKYFSNYVASAKTETTKARRIAAIIHALQHKWDYATMIKYEQKKRQL